MDKVKFYFALFYFLNILNFGWAETPNANISSYPSCGYWTDDDWETKDPSELKLDIHAWTKIYNDRKLEDFKIVSHPSLTYTHPPFHIGFSAYAIGNSTNLTIIFKNNKKEHLQFDIPLKETWFDFYINTTDKHVIIYQNSTVFSETTFASKTILINGDSSIILKIPNYKIKWSNRSSNTPSCFNILPNSKPYMLILNSAKGNGSNFIVTKIFADKNTSNKTLQVDSTTLELDTTELSRISFERLCEEDTCDKFWAIDISCKEKPRKSIENKNCTGEVITAISIFSAVFAMVIGGTVIAVIFKWKAIKAKLCTPSDRNGNVPEIEELPTDGSNSQPEDAEENNFR